MSSVQQATSPLVEKAVSAIAGGGVIGILSVVGGNWYTNGQQDMAIQQIHAVQEDQKEANRLLRQMREDVAYLRGRFDFSELEGSGKTKSDKERLRERIPQGN